MDRQKLRKSLLLISFLALPVTLFYLSPILILMGAREGVLTGSAIMFMVLFLVSIFVGRAWCGWICPQGALQDLVASRINNRPIDNTGRINLVKYLIWIPWISLIALLIIFYGGISAIEPFYHTNHGVSAASLFTLAIYYIIITLVFLIAAILGRRGACHSVCHMAVFQIIGRSIRNLLRLPALHIKPSQELCNGCQRCSRECPMSLEVTAMVKSRRVEHPECILCGTCADSCPKHALSFAFGRN
jgi:polyferredoxin